MMSQCRYCGDDRDLVHIRICVRDGGLTSEVLTACRDQAACWERERHRQQDEHRQTIAGGEREREH